jgi:hypothetical protein
LKTCTAPGLITGGSATVVDGYAWQDFLTCYLKMDISQIVPGWDYFPVNDKPSAFSLMLVVIDQFKKSDMALYLTEAETTQVMLVQSLKLIVNREGYGARELPVLLTENKIISQDKALNPAGMANETIGGQDISANGEIA